VEEWNDGFKAAFLFQVFPRFQLSINVPFFFQLKGGFAPAAPERQRGESLNPPYFCLPTGQKKEETSVTSVSVVSN